MSDEVKRAIEKRVIQATDRNLMGAQGKLGCILRNMGQPIYQEGGGFIDTNYLDAPWYEDFSDGNSDIADPEDEDILVLGWHFDGLTSGVQLEIRYLDKTKELMASWKGRMVYQEVRGELRAYAPGDEWEGAVDRLYQGAKKRDRVALQREKEEEAAKDMKEKLGFLAALKRLWGIG